MTQKLILASLLLCLTLTVCRANMQTTSSTSSASVQLTPTQAVIPTIISTQTLPVPTPELYPESVCVVYAVHNTIYLWSGGQSRLLVTEPVRSTSKIAASRISPDGQIVAFIRDERLWAVNSDGSDERLLLGPPAFEKINPNFRWIPNTHLIIFNGSYIYDTDEDIYWQFVEPSLLGAIYPSPDGHWLAMVSPSRISIVRTNGTEYHPVFEYAKLCYPTDIPYYARPIWGSDSHTLMVAMPDEHAYCTDTPLETRIWRISIPKRESSVVAEIPFGRSEYISPDLAKVVSERTIYDSGSNTNATEIYVTDLVTRQSDLVLSNSAGIYLQGWTPDSAHYFYFSNSDKVFMLGDLEGNTRPLTQETYTVLVKWIDGTHFLYTRQRAVYLGTIGKHDILVAELAENDTFGIFNVFFSK